MLTGNPWCAKCQGYAHPATYDCDAARERHFAKMNEDAFKSMAESALTAEPSRVEDTQVENAFRNMAEACCCEGDGKPCVPCKTADLIRRLAAAKASAERERDEARAQIDDAEGAVSSAQFEAEHWAKEYRDAEAKLREARGVALEEAAKVCEATIDRHFTGVTDALAKAVLAGCNERADTLASRIRALSNPE